MTDWSGNVCEGADSILVNLPLVYLTQPVQNRAAEVPLMSYCYHDTYYWISDYHHAKALGYRIEREEERRRSAADRRPSLVLWETPARARSRSTPRSFWTPRRRCRRPAVRTGSRDGVTVAGHCSR